MEQKRGVISLIPKKGLDRRMVKNWRPITLLNMDYKIFTKAVAMRLQQCVQQIVHKNQNGFVARRQIGTNIRTIQDVIDSSRDSGSQAFILALDYKKAFDSLQWETIYKALSVFNFGERFIDSIKMLFCNIETCISNAGFTSEYFSPTNGVRQGCCASPLLFVISIEMLALMIRNDNRVRGVFVRDLECRISQFADDTTCFASSEDSLRRILDIIQKFSKFSGLKINPDKSAIMSVGRPTGLPDSVRGISFKERAKILGVWFARDRTDEDHYSWNFSPQLSWMRQICGSWSNRLLSIKGRVTVFNSLVISLIQYIAMNTFTPTKVNAEVRKIASSFIWAGKRSKLAYSTIIQSIPEGGLRVMDLESRIKVYHLGWIRKILNNPESSSAEFVKSMLGVAICLSSWDPSTHFLLLCHTSLNSMRICCGSGQRSTTSPQSMRTVFEGKLSGITRGFPPLKTCYSQCNGNIGSRQTYCE